MSFTAAATFSKLLHLLENNSSNGFLHKWFLNGTFKRQLVTSYFKAETAYVSSYFLFKIVILKIERKMAEA